MSDEHTRSTSSLPRIGDLVIKVSTHPQMTHAPSSKADKQRMSRMADGWQRKTMTFQELSQYIGRGGAIAPYYRDNYRKKANFESLQVLVVDYDDDAPSLRDILNHPLVREYPCIIGESGSSTPENPRFHIYFPLAEPITDYDQAKRALQIIQYQFHFGESTPDDTGDQPERHFLGCQNQFAEIGQGIPLTWDVIQTLNYPEPETPIQQQVTRSETRRKRKRPRKTPLNPKLLDAVEDALRSSGFTSNGSSWLNGCSPLRDDRHPSFSFNLDSGYGYDHALKETYILKDMCQALNLDWGAYGGIFDPNAIPDPQRILWPDGLTEGAWSFFIQRPYFKDGTAPVVNLLNEAIRYGYVDPNGFTYDDVTQASVHLGIPIPERTIQSTLTSLEGYFTQILDSINTAIISKNCVKSRGRPPRWYRVLPFGEMVDGLLEQIGEGVRNQVYQSIIPKWTMRTVKDMGLDDPKAIVEQFNQQRLRLLNQDATTQQQYQETLKRRRNFWRQRLYASYVQELPPAWPLTTIGECRAALLHAWIKDEPGTKWTREFISYMLGCSKGSVSDILHNAGVESERRRDSLRIERPIDVWDQISTFSRKVRGFPLYVIADERYRLDWLGTDLDTFVQHQQALGYQVHIQLITPSYREVITDDRPAPKPKSQSENSTGSSRSCNPVKRRRELLHMLKLANKDSAFDKPHFEDVLLDAVLSLP